jgi:hypothetical protein
MRDSALFLVRYDNRDCSGQFAIRASEIKTGQRRRDRMIAWVREEQARRDGAPRIRVGKIPQTGAGSA